MTFTRILAQSTVSDLDRATHWYSRLFDRGPDARPMDGLLEWYLPGPHASGFQVWREPERAGYCGTVLDTEDLDATHARLLAAGLNPSAIQQVTSWRLVALVDDDGNRIAITGA